MLLALLLALTASAANTDASPDDCTLDKEAIAPMLDAASAKDYAVEREERQVTERALVKGRRLRTGLGGCAHFGFSFAFALNKAETPSGATALALAQKLLAAVPTTKHGDAQVRILQRALAEARAQSRTSSDGAIALPCGDAICELRISEGELILSYDFAM